ncbi:MAG: RNA polymerase sigma factor, partial [Candidatus Hydrogenedentes bacterium]|nr:RNA polymerase sigma factor [Candidatus Hydrogenedentota bacterium]
VKMYQDMVCVVVLPIVGELATAQDIVQDTFIQAYTKAHQLADERKFPGWLRTIAVNKARMWVRRRKRESSFRQDTIASSDRSISGRSLDPELRGDDFSSELMRLVASLSEKRRVPVLLCYVKGLRRREAAQFLGISENALRKRLYDAKAELQREIVEFAERTLQEYRLPPGFAERCVCNCERSRKGVRTMAQKKRRVKSATPQKKGDCLCGCLLATKGKERKK